ncbi:hypothetical protein PT974_06621 [Cladobotryum mycophilum]|uniref:Uncharacterized protein n=1 Tax=Cladobotryum mycophilum TaxID=491253 RepID=A0ABR0SLZ4_9HYPO
MAVSMMLRTLPTRSLAALRAATSPQRLPRRSYATKQPNPTSEFYKTFTRPVGKVLVLAIFTYQVAYWTWTKLEADEVREETDGECELLP